MAGVSLPMGFVLTLLFLLTSYLSPGLLFGELAQYHFEIILGVLALLASIPAFPQSRVLRAPQTLAIAGICLAVFASFLFNGLARDAPTAAYEVLANCFAFFLVGINCRTKLRLQILVVCFFAASVYIITQGVLALQSGMPVSPWLYDQGFEGNTILRLRGLGVVNDPNDLAQVFVGIVPCTFLLLRPKKFIWNTCFVLVPCLVLLYGVFLTHSRGALVAVMVVIGLAIYRKLGVLPATIAAGVIFALSSVIGWSGGRDISVEAGSDRTDAWATGLSLIRSHPIFGVGYRRFADFNEITAHNTIVVCAAELGFVGLFFWVLFVVSSLRQGADLRPAPNKRSRKDREAEYAYTAPAGMQLQSTAGPVPDTVLMRGPGSDQARGLPREAASNIDAPFGSEIASPRLEDEASIRRLAWVMTVCLAGFLAAGWFLSRAYVMWLFMFGGMMQAVYRMAVDQGVAPPAPSMPRLLRLAAIVSFILLFIVYVFLRAKKFFPGG